MDTIGIRVREMPAPTKWNQKEREWLAKAKESVKIRRTDDEITEDVQREIKSIFDALLPHAKGVD